MAIVDVVKRGATSPWAGVLIAFAALGKQYLESEHTKAAARTVVEVVDTNSDSTQKNAAELRSAVLALTANVVHLNDRLAAVEATCRNQDADGDAPDAETVVQRSPARPETKAAVAPVAVVADRVTAARPSLPVPVALPTPRVPQRAAPALENL